MYHHTSINFHCSIGQFMITFFSKTCPVFTDDQCFVYTIDFLFTSPKLRKIFSYSQLLYCYVSFIYPQFIQVIYKHIKQTSSCL